MTPFTKGRKALADGLSETAPSASSPNVSAPRLAVLARYFFNLTNGDAMIRDEEGIEASSLQAAVISAMEAVEELRAQDPSNADEWQGWRLEIVDAEGRAVHAIPLDALSHH
jgi:hypothetical protein